MPTPVLRQAYEAESAKGSTSGYWEMSEQTRLLFLVDGQDFCGLPTRTVDAPLGEWWLYPADENDPYWREHLQVLAFEAGEHILPGTPIQIGTDGKAYAILHGVVRVSVKAVNVQVSGGD